MRSRDQRLCSENLDPAGDRVSWHRSATVVAIALALVAAAWFAASSAAHAMTTCPSAVVLASRGSGDKLGKDKGMGAPGLAFYAALKKLDPQVQAWPNPYNAVGIFSWFDPRKDINGLGAITKTSGLKVGAYHDSVVGGENDLRTRIASTAAVCGTKTEVVLVGYSQGAQVTADVYQRSLTAAQRAQIAAVVLFGDPYFNGGDRTVDRGSFSGRRDGVLGKRSRFGSGGTLVLSYCHSHDPVCQGVFVRLGPTRTLDPGALTFAQHKNYTKFGEPQAAAALVAKLLTTTSSSSSDAWPVHRNDGPPALYIWLGASFIDPSWASCTPVYCIVGDDADQRVLIFRIQGGLNELGWIAENQDPPTALANAGFGQADIDSLLAPTTPHAR